MSLPDLLEMVYETSEITVSGMRDSKKFKELSFSGAALEASELSGHKVINRIHLRYNGMQLSDEEYCDKHADIALNEVYKEVVWFFTLGVYWGSNPEKKPKSHDNAKKALVFDFDLRTLIDFQALALIDDRTNELITKRIVGIHEMYASVFRYSMIPLSKVSQDACTRLVAGSSCFEHLISGMRVGDALKSEEALSEILNEDEE